MYLTPHTNTNIVGLYLGTVIMTISYIDMLCDIKGAVPLLASTVSNRRHQKQLASQLFWEKKKRVTSGRNTGFGFG